MRWGHHHGRAVNIALDATLKAACNDACDEQWQCERSEAINDTTKGSSCGMMTPSGSVNNSLPTMATSQGLR